MTVNNEYIRDKSDSNQLLDRFQAYGRESIEPFVGILEKYGDTVSAYLEAMEEGLRGAGATLIREEGDQNQIRRTVGQWFQEYSSWLGNLRGSFQGNNSQGLLNFIEREGVRQPAALLASSILTGTFLGRLGRSAVHVLKKDKIDPADAGVNEQINGGHYGSQSNI